MPLRIFMMLSFIYRRDGGTWSFLSFLPRFCLTVVVRVWAAWVEATSEGSLDSIKSRTPRKFYWM